jgi:NAD-dependent DNA ligase
LNKEDLFEDKFKENTASLEECFPDYVQTDSPEKAKEFIAKKFVECDESSKMLFNNNNNSPREIYWHYTYALDRKNIEAVVASVKDRILKLMLESMRL